MSVFGDAAMRDIRRASAQRRAEAGVLERLVHGRQKYLVAAICVAICTIMLLPLVASVLASLKSTAEAAAVPPPTAAPPRTVRTARGTRSSTAPGAARRHGRATTAE